MNENGEVRNKLYHNYDETEKNNNKAQLLLNCVHESLHHLFTSYNDCMKQQEYK